MFERVRGGFRVLAPAFFALALALACSDSPTGPAGPDLTAEEERIGRQIEASGFAECIAEFQRVLPTLSSLTFEERRAELLRILALCFAPPTPPAPGDLEVNTSTTGDNLDADGYTVAVQGQTSQAVGINSSVTFNDLPPGNYQVTLQGEAGNCTVSGSNPRAVNVPSGGTGSTTFDVACTGPPPTGDLEVNTSTTGDLADLDPDGYTVAVTGQSSTPIDINATITYAGLAPGDYEVELQDVAANCTVAGNNPRTVNVPSGGTGSTTFDVTCAPPGGPAGIIVFVSDLTGSDEIHVMNADGSNVTQLTTNNDVEIHSRISTNGQQIVFASDEDGDREIFIMDVDGSNVTQLTFNTVRDQEPRISPDGTQIAFERRVAGVDQVFVMNADGTGQTQLTFETANSGEPAWSPDGSQIVFSSSRLGGIEVWVMDADGSNPVRLTTTAGANGDPVWFGSQIAFESSRSGTFEIFLMNDDGTGQTPITSNPGVDSVDPAWSPDGTMIAFERTAEVFTMNSDGSSVANITNSADLDTNPSWGPGSI